MSYDLIFVLYHLLHKEQIAEQLLRLHICHLSNACASCDSLFYFHELYAQTSYRTSFVSRVN